MVTDLLALPTGVLVAIGLLVAAELVLAAVALVDLYRRPAQQVVSGNKWIWLVLILILSLLGPALYLLVGRKTPSSVAPSETPNHSQHTGATEAIEKLYGRQDHPY